MAGRYTRESPNHRQKFIVSVTEIFCDQGLSLQKWTIASLTVKYWLRTALWLPVTERAIHFVIYLCFSSFNYYPFGVVGRMWNFIESPFHTTSIFFKRRRCFLRLLYKTSYNSLAPSLSSEMWINKINEQLSYKPLSDPCSPRVTK